MDKITTLLTGLMALSVPAVFAVEASAAATRTVSIVYAAGTATATPGADVANEINISIDGANVAVSQNEGGTGEIVYELSGASSNGQFFLEGNRAATVVLSGLSLTSTAGAPLDFQSTAGVRLTVADGTTNTLADATDGAQKGCVVSIGSLTIDGSGSLTLAGNTGHAIYAKDYVTLTDASITVTSAVKDGINCTRQFTMTGGSADISGVGDDCIQIDYNNADAPADDDTGAFVLSGGSLTLYTAATAAKCVKTEGNMEISGGTIDATATGGGEWNSKKSKTKAAACLGCDGDFKLTDGTLRLKATGGGGKGISVDGVFAMSGGQLSINTSGGIYAYINGTEYQNYTGNTDNIDSDLRSSPKGVKADSGMTIDGGEIDIVTTGNGAEGLESKSTLTINGGTIYIKAYDDAINSSSHMYLNGGEITVISTGNDALDSNGNLYVNGGHITACGPGAPEGGIDANEEEGFTVVFTGGELLATGGRNSLPGNNESNQPYLSVDIALSAGATITVEDDGVELASFEIPAEYSGSSNPGGNRPGGRPVPGGWPGQDPGQDPGMNPGQNPGQDPGHGPGGMNDEGTIITCPGLFLGKTYTVKSGTTSTEAKAMGYGPTAGVLETIAKEEATETKAIYNLNGIRIASDDAPAGVYIIRKSDGSVIKSARR